MGSFSTFSSFVIFVIVVWIFSTLLSDLVISTFCCCVFISLKDWIFWLCSGICVWACTWGWVWIWSWTGWPLASVVGWAGWSEDFSG